MKIIARILLIFSCASAWKLEWAPRRPLKQPYVTFLNDFFKPTWISTDSQAFINHSPFFYAPRNVHIGMICGGCFTKKHKSSDLKIYSGYSSSFSVKSPPYGRYWKVGNNKCLLVYASLIVKKNITRNSIFCDLTLDGKKTDEHINFAFLNYTHTNGSIFSLVRERVNFTSSLNCQREGNVSKSIGNSTNTTVWWYQSKNITGVTPFFISKDSTFSGAVPKDIKNEIGCTTYEISKHRILRAYEKVYNLNNLSIYNNYYSSTTGSTKFSSTTDSTKFSSTTDSTKFSSTTGSTKFSSTTGSTKFSNIQIWFVCVIVWVIYVVTLLCTIILCVIIYECFTDRIRRIETQKKKTVKFRRLFEEE